MTIGEHRKAEQALERLSAKIDSKFEILMATMDADHESLIYLLSIHRRLQAIERKV
jgi:hypothetical protein